MPNDYFPQGTLVTPVSGYAKTKITAVANTTPIQVTATAAPATGDTIVIEGTGGVADGRWQATNLSGTTFSLNGSTANGTATAGYFIDYQLSPFLSLISDGTDILNAANLNPPVEANANMGPFLYERVGKWRVYNQYTWTAGNLVFPYNTSPWVTQAATATPTLVTGSNVTLTSASDTPSIPPVIAAGDMLVIDGNFTVLIPTSSFYINVGLNLTQGGVGTSALIGSARTVTPLPTVTNFATPVAIHAVFVAASPLVLPATNLGVAIMAWIDAASGTESFELIGPWTGSVIQYRNN